LSTHGHYLENTAFAIRTIVSQPLPIPHRSRLLLYD